MDWKNNYQLEKKARNVHCREVKGKMFWFFTFFCYFHNKEDTYIDRVRVMVEALRHFSTPTMRYVCILLPMCHFKYCEIIIVHDGPIFVAF